MWYFTWILGLSFAAAFAALNAMWLELSPDGDSGPAAERAARGDPGVSGEASPADPHQDRP
jgi:cyd operon protein YbgT